MILDDVLNCPLCEGHGQMRRSELLRLLEDKSFREKIEKYLSQGKEFTDKVTISTAVDGKQSRDFETEAHSWNPNVSPWRRSPKE